jgi:hypothetical protein
MKLLAALPLAALWLALVAADSPSPTSPASPSPSPSPTYTPVINLNPPAGPPGTTVTVTGTQLPPNQAFSVIWDNNHSTVLGSGKADGSGNFTTQVQVPDNPVGGHGICLTQPANVCASFTLQAKPSPSPTPTPTPTPSPSPSPSAIPSPSPTPSTLAPTRTDQTAKVNGLTLLLQPPFVFFPLLVILALVVALGIWVRTLMKPREPELEASVSHHRVRGVDYGIPDDQPNEVELPPAPGFLAPPPSQTQPQPPPAAPEPPAPKPPPPRPAGSDEPPDLPEPGE